MTTVICKVAETPRCRDARSQTCWHGCGW